MTMRIKESAYLTCRGHDIWKSTWKTIFSENNWLLLEQYIERYSEERMGIKRMLVMTDMGYREQSGSAGI